MLRENVCVNSSGLDTRQFAFKFLVTHAYRLRDLFVPREGNTDNGVLVFGKNMQIFSFS